MAKGESVGTSEEVVRAGLYPYWDADLKRATPSAFTAAEVSVSRLAILDLAQIVTILRKDFDGRVHPDGESMKVCGTGLGAVEKIIKQADAPKSDSSMTLPNLLLTVVEDKIENEPGATDNPAHALICGWDRMNPKQPRKISRGVATRLRDVFTWAPLLD
jgi:hypothetical protein